ncbi:MAG: hypothetical protein JWQ19_2073 [Subtercola sp.]|nr:hypothetical protein [Subtercola sp.]
MKSILNYEQLDGGGNGAMHMNDRDEISNLMTRYAELYDSGQHEAYAQLFVHGRIVGPGGEVRATPAEILEYHANHSISYDDGTPRTAHNISNVFIEVDEGGETARARCYFTVVQEAPGFALQVISAGQYHDDLIKVDGAWFFEERRATMRFAGDMHAHIR